MSQSKMVSVIMAGGRGTRFWPLSRRDRPKQMLNIVGEQSMLQMTVDRLRKLRFMEEIYIIVGRDLAEKISNEINGVPKHNIIVEPSRKNTALSIALVALHLRQKNPDTVMGIFPADHLVVGHRAFSSAISAGRKLAESDDMLSTLGVVPSSAHTGYGYIQFDKKKPLLEKRAFGVKTFAEKPTAAAAKRFIASGDFLWNSGMFVWKTKTYLEAMELHMPIHWEIMSKIGDDVGTRRYKTTLEAEWDNLTPESIDYGILEHAKNICVVQSEFKWSDLGSWNAYYDIMTKKEDGNVIKGEGIVIDGSGNLIHSNGKLTTVLGLSDIAVINTEDAILVIPQQRVEEIREIVSQLEEKGKENLL
ncbi:MAG: mannose-1-phosphate guanylyltransferase [Candidatus Marinimicrobia bacterium]|nr:mannose-1-phosphate guanylyltransferase [Candidatus Neomarinimicrobiota bacterium]